MIDFEMGEPARIAIALVLGLIFGSFANVCIHRLPLGLSVVWPGSACPSCRRAIPWHDNIPVVSWVILGGRCRSCRWPIPWRYPLVEASSGALVAALVMQHGLSVRWFALSWLALSILVLVPIDWRHGILPDRVTLPGIAAGIALSPFSDDPGLGGALMGALVGGVAPFTVRTLYMAYVGARSAWRHRLRARIADAPAGEAAVQEEEDAEEQREGMGLGDVKMLAMVGAFLGISKVLLTMLLGSVIGSLYVVPLVLLGRHTMKTPVAFGPFLGIAAIISLFWGADIVAWYFALVVTLPLGG